MNWLGLINIDLTQPTTLALRASSERHETVDNFLPNLNQKTMDQIKESAIKYLEHVLAPLVPGGCEILIDDNMEKGLAFSLIPKVYGDYKFLIGPRGSTIGTIRSIMRLWRDRNAPEAVVINLYVPDPRAIQDE